MTMADGLYELDWPMESLPGGECMLLFSDEIESVIILWKHALHDREY